VIARVHGDAVAGGSDIIIMNEKARIGYPPSRVWGCPTTAMWVYRLGAEKAKQMLFTGDLISGKRAAEVGLVFQSVPLSEQHCKTCEIYSLRSVTLPWSRIQMTISFDNILNHDFQSHFDFYPAKKGPLL